MFHLEFQLGWINIFEGTIKFEIVIDCTKIVNETHNSVIKKCLSRTTGDQRLYKFILIKIEKKVCPKWSRVYAQQSTAIRLLRNSNISSSKVAVCNEERNVCPFPLLSNIQTSLRILNGVLFYP